MAAARDTTAANIKPLNGSIVRRYDAGATIAAGELVAMQSDGAIDPANTTSATVAVAGVAVQGASSGDRIDVVVFGPVVCMTGATIGSVIHATNTAGEPGETAGSNAGVAGWAESATVLFVNPSVA